MGLLRRHTGAYSLADDEAFQKVARRKSGRELSNANVDFIEPVKTEGVAVNISEGGMRVAVYEKIPTEEDCIVKIWLTDDHHVSKRARIVWTKEAPDGWVLGLEFVEEQASESSSVKSAPITT